MKRFNTTIGGLGLALGCAALLAPTSADAGFVPPPPPRARVVSNGALSRAVVRSHIRRHLPAVRHCYVLELGRTPRLRTTVAIRFEILATGHVRGARTGKRPIDRCVARAVRRVRFPEVFDIRADGTRSYGRSTHVSYRFRFRPAKRPGRRRRARPSRSPRRPLRALPGLLPVAPRPSPTRPSRRRPRTAPPATSPARGGPTLPLPRSDDPLEGIKLK